MSVRNSLFVLLFSISIAREATGQSQEKIYSALILNFARGIQWPPAKAGEQFVIGVLGYQPLAIELSSLAAKNKVGKKEIIIKEYSNSDEIQNCHILFIPAYKNKALQLVLKQLGVAPTLVITNKSQSAANGSGVNLVFVEGKLRYEINCRSIERRGMKISANMKGMGIVVD